MDKKSNFSVDGELKREKTETREGKASLTVKVRLIALEPPKNLMGAFDGDGRNLADNLDNFNVAFTNNTNKHEFTLKTEGVATAANSTPGPHITLNLNEKQPETSTGG